MLVVAPPVIVEVPRDRPSTAIHHHVSTSDRDVEPLSVLFGGRSTVTEVETKEKPAKVKSSDAQYEYVTSTTTTIRTVRRLEEIPEPTVVFGVSQAPKVTREVISVEEGPTLVGARTVQAAPPEEFVTSREVFGSTTSTVTTAPAPVEKEKKPKGAGILKNRKFYSCFIH